MKTPYIPFGNDWENQMMKLSKKQLIKLLKRYFIANNTKIMLGETSYEEGEYECLVDYSYAICEHTDQVTSIEIDQVIDHDENGEEIDCKGLVDLKEVVKAIIESLDHEHISDDCYFECDNKRIEL